MENTLYYGISTKDTVNDSSCYLIVFTSVEDAQRWYETKENDFRYRYMLNNFKKAINALGHGGKKRWIKQVAYQIENPEMYYQFENNIEELKKVK